jgi:Flp pilus assembly protein TadB
MGPWGKAAPAVKRDAASTTGPGDGKSAMLVGALVLAFGCVLLIVADSAGATSGKIVGGVVAAGGFLTYVVGRARYRRHGR